MNQPRARPFAPGNTQGRGRPKGSRNKVGKSAGQNLLDEYSEHVIRKCISLAMQRAPTRQPGRFGVYCRELTPLSTLRRSCYLLLAVLTWTLAVAWIVEPRRPILNDTAWLVRVSQRIASGEVLYRDIFFGSTPLAIYLQTILMCVTGYELMALRLIDLLFWNATLWLCAVWARQNRVPDRLILLAALAFLLPPPESFYNTLASFFFVAAAVFRGRPRLSGFCAAMAFGAKWTVGLLALAAGVIAGIWNRESASWRPRFAAWFLLGALLVLSPVVLSRGTAAFADYVFWNKTTYVRTSSELVGSWFHNVLSNAPPTGLPILSSARSWPLRFLKLGFYLGQLCLPIVVILLSRRVWREPDPGRRQAWIHGLASLGMLIPAIWHVVWATPVLLVSAVLAPRKPPSRMVVAALAAGTIASAIWNVSQMRIIARVPLGLKHYSGVLVTRQEHDRLTAEVGQLRSASFQYAPLFLAFPAAGFYLLAGDVPPVSPYEIPAATSFGRHGEEDTIRRFRNVCLGEYRFNAPRRLQEWSQSRLHAGRDLGPCRLYSVIP